MAQSVNINYPFKDSKKGFFLDLNVDPNQAIKADLLHLILTQRGQRLYMPDFGTNLLKFIFEPNDELTYAGILEEIRSVTKKFLPKLTFTELKIEPSDESDYAAVVTMQYVITDGVFDTTDIIVIKI
jgi:phage baseplate assembly protein W